MKKIELTDEQKQDVGKLAPYLTVDQMADYLGIARRTFFDILDRDEELSALYKKAKTKMLAKASSTLISIATNSEEPNVTALIFLLKTQGGWKEDKTPVVEEVKQTERVITYRVIE
jgi:hypothetical protein